jgi:branched-chain amino acid aminotransferase
MADLDPQADLPSIELKPTTAPLAAEQREQILAEPGFGRYFTDHMVLIRWTEGRGWHDAELVPYGPVSFDPATSALHYGQEIFEGLKAYRQPDGSIASFRPLANAERFRRSARRIAMAELPDELFLGSIQALVTQDADWVPSGRERSLYLRPFMVSTEVGLGVRPSNAYLYVLIASPAGAYFPSGVKPVTVWLSEEYTRAAPGGTGAAKFAGNYASSLIAQAQAAAQGCDQVVWLDAVEHRWVEEMGGMNLYFVRGRGDDATVVTPELTGTLLPGITRDSLLQVARDLGLRSAEGRLSTDDWYAGNESGEISEVFACGTAAVITPVGAVKSARRSWTVGDGQTGPVTTRLREALLDIQTGAAPDTHGWLHQLVPAP